MDFTIVTPSLGQLGHLECCIASVADQQGISVEHIVQDAGTDGFAEFAEKMRQRWPDRPNYRRLMISEPDSGMYDAINKGLKKGTGRICAYLNCDEQYLAGALAKVMEEFKKQSAIEILYGGFIVVNEKGELVTAQRPVKMFWQHIATSHLPNFTCATFFKREMMERDQAWFDSKLKYCGDLQWAIERLKAGISFCCIPTFVSTFLEHSRNFGLSQEGLAEAARIRKSSPSWVQKLGILWKVVHRTRKLIEGAYFPCKVGAPMYLKENINARRELGGKWIITFWASRWLGQFK